MSQRIKHHFLQRSIPTVTLSSILLLWQVGTATAGRYPVEIAQQVETTSLQANTPAVEQAIAQYRQLYTQAEQLKTQGTIGSWRQAIARYEQALSISRREDIRKAYPKEARYLEAGTLVNIGTVYRNIYYSQKSLNDNQKALEYYKQALPIWRKYQYPSEEGQTHFHLASTYLNLGNNKSSLVHYKQALSFFRAENNKNLEALTLRGIGQVYHISRALKQASNYYNQALQIQQQIGDYSGQQVTNCLLRSIKEPKGADKCIQQAL
ncbi:MAG: tetratricopeptide repeat protein [Fischerella sp.]|nr:tetratricopeptide repeat protein [Fischerella sp.]